MLILKRKKNDSILIGNDILYLTATMDLSAWL